MWGANPCSWLGGKGYSHVGGYSMLMAEWQRLQSCGGLIHAHGLVTKVTVMWGATPCSWLSGKGYSHVGGYSMLMA